MRKKFPKVFSDLEACFFKYFKRGEANNFLQYFEICKYTFLNI